MEENIVLNKEDELRLESTGIAIRNGANDMKITCQEDYEKAGKLLVEIKTRIKQVKDYWKKPKADAAAAHKTMCERENEMLKPLSDAETIIKKTMVSYQAEVERARKEAEEEERKRKEEETERLLADAIKAEENGDKEDAEIKIAMAQIVDDMKPTAFVASPVAENTSVRKVWKARVIDPMKVPAYVNGIEVREIKMSALNGLAKMSNGELKVDGVEFYQESQIVART